HITVPPIAGKTAVMDIMAVDQSNHLLWVADGTDLGIDTFDISSVPGRYVSTIPVGALPNGLVIAADLNRLYSGDDDSTVAVIDIDPHSKTFNTIIARIQIEPE